jgi:hypothetical protein
MVLSGMIAFVVVTASSLLAGTNGFVVPSFRSSANSEFGYWETFTVPSGTPGNLPDQPGATTGAILTQFNTNAFLTGSGNIYNLSISSFALTDNTPFALGTVVLQTRTIGSELDYGSISLIYSNESGSHVLAPLFHYELNRTSGQGFNVSSLWQWDLTGLSVTNYSVVFNAAGDSVSFDSLTLDVANQFAPVFPQQPFALRSTPANLARWMYPFNGNPASRPTASVFGGLGSTPDFDSRDAQYLLGWNTTNRIPVGQGAANYLIRRARVTLTIASGNQYLYSGTLRDYRSYFPTNDPRHIASTNVGAPVELFGAGYRGGYTSATFPQDGPWGVNPSGYFTNRTVYAAGFDTNGVLADVSNNVGDDETNEISAPFEIAPFAVGQSTNVAEGQLMPSGGRLTFDVNLDDPLIYGYVQRALNEGNLNFMATSLQAASLSGPPNYPNFYTSFSPIATADQYPLLDIEGEIVRANIDSDADGLPDDWENFHFGSLSGGATNDADGDGVNNLAEYRAGTIPVSSASKFKTLSLQRQANSAEIRFTFAPSHQYNVGWSDNLQSWQTVTNPVLTYSSAWLTKTTTNAIYPSPVYGVWHDTNAISPQRFYRVEAQ